MYCVESYGFDILFTTDFNVKIGLSSRGIIGCLIAMKPKEANVTRFPD